MAAIRDLDLITSRLHCDLCRYCNACAFAAGTPLRELPLSACTSSAGESTSALSGLNLSAALLWPIAAESTLVTEPFHHSFGTMAWHHACGYEFQFPYHGSQICGSWDGAKCRCQFTDSR
ncbi:hypothetical protein V5799_034179 [Amblyomma americanum]|uniref:Uncharacterized protein n=1 Tax=Amblyomma americanum TaxID=6943 RepID=A0AAQ4DL77_AMBAM